MLIHLLLGSNALALTPGDNVHIGQEPVRILRFSPERQHALRHSAGWQTFLAGEGAGWQARFDEHAGTIHRAWGPGIEMGPLGSVQDAQEAILRFIERNPDLLAGVEPGALLPGRSGYDARTDTWYVDLDRMVGEVPVWRSRFTARIKQGRLIMIGALVFPGADDLDTTPAISDVAAIERAIQDGPAPDALHLGASAERIILPLDDGSGVTYRLCWLVRTSTTTPPGQWVSFVDAQTGELLNVHNEVRFLSGYLEGEHDVRYPNGDLEDSPLGGVRLTSSDDSTETDEVGWFELDGGSATATLTSDEVTVSNNAGSDARLTLYGDATWTASSASQSELDVYVFLHRIRDWADEYAPQVNNSWTRVDAYVNLNSTCNAYFDGTVNFYQSGSGCNNTGRIADVIFHEWGHGFHYYNLLSGSWDGSMSEGIGDTVAFLQTGDSTIAPYFYTNGGGIRDVSDDRVYPDDWTGEVHADGLIFAGAVWDLWELMREGYDDPDEADALIQDMLVAALRGGPTTEESYDEFVAADDDNGDLGDGTPHLCFIMDAFGRHGLGPGGTAKLIELSHTPLGNQSAAAASYPIDADVVNYGEICGYDIASAALYYSIDDGDSWEQASMSISGEAAAGSIPAQAPGTRVLYYLAATSTDDTTHTSPSGGEITPLSFYVGELIELYCEDFEADDGGYTSELLAGEDGAGADDWMWGEPKGNAEDPDFAYSGDSVWGNDLGGTIDGQQYNGEYQADKHNRLSSVAIDTQGYEQVVVQFQRWLNVEDGYYDQATVLINEEAVWENHATSNSIGDEHHQDSQWALQTIIVDAADLSELVISWDIESDAGLEFGGWNIDDVCVYGVGSSDSIPGGGDDTGGDGTGNIDGDGDGDAWSYGCGCASTGPGRTSGGLLLGLWLAGIALLRRRD